MQINITARHDTKATSAIKERILSKLRKYSQHYDHITNIQVTLDKNSKHDFAEATLHLETGNEIFAKAQGPNMYSAIDALNEKIGKQIRRTKSKMLSHKGHLQDKRSAMDTAIEAV